MKIKLIHPPNYHMFHPPLGIATLVGFLREKGFRVEQDDLEAKTLFLRMCKKIDLTCFYNKNKVVRFINGKSCPDIEKNVGILLDIIKYQNYDIFGFSILTNIQSSIALCIAKSIKQKTGACIIFGGHYSSMAVTGFKKYDFIDHIIIGEGEYPLLNLLNSLSKKEGVREKIIYSQNNTDINKNPPPEFDRLSVEKVYKKIGLNMLPYELLKGCINRCSFCTPDSLGRLRFKTPDIICEDLKYIKNKYGIEYFYFVDSAINHNRKFMTELCEEMIKRKVGASWIAHAHANGTLFSNSSLKKMREAGCIQLKLGVESGSNVILSAMNKQITAEISHKALKKVHQQGISTYVFIIHSYINETRKDFLKTVKYVIENAKYIDVIRPSKFELYWNSPIFNNASKFGIGIRNYDMEGIFYPAEFPYDEVNGLKWEAKVKQQGKDRKEILRIANKLGIFNETNLRRLRYPLPGYVQLTYRSVRIW